MIHRRSPGLGGLFDVNVTLGLRDDPRCGMRILRMRRHLVPTCLVLATFALAMLFAGATGAAHGHGAPGVYNPDCQLLALATLGSAVTLAAIATALGAAPAAIGAVVGVDVRLADAPHARPRSRAPPASRD